MPVANPQDNVHGVEPTGPDAWFRSLPIITRLWFGATVILTVAGNLGFLSPVYFVFSWEMVLKKFELWRLATCFCFAGKFSFNTLIAMYTLVTFSKNYESGGPFNTGAGGGTADYAFCMLLSTGLMMASFVFLKGIISPIFCRNLIYFVLYIWARRNPTSHANLWGIPMKAAWLPFAYLALAVLTGDFYLDILHGYAIGHLFYFMADVVPQVYGKDILQTPVFLIDYFGVGHYQPEPAQNDARNNPWRGGTAGTGGEGNTNRGGHNWGGGGRTLGRS